MEMNKIQLINKAQSYINEADSLIARLKDQSPKSFNEIVQLRDDVASFRKKLTEEHIKLIPLRPYVPFYLKPEEEQPIPTNDEAVFYEVMGKAKKKLQIKKRDPNETIISFLEICKVPILEYILKNA